MDIHEYQAKHLLQLYNVPAPKGAHASSPQDIDNALALLPEGMLVVKSQIHAGGRGKGTFTDGFKGGVKLAKSKPEAKSIAFNMLGNTLITHQTGPQGKKVNTVYFTQASDIQKEFYLAITLDRSSSKIMIIASTEGGMDIETVAAQSPTKIVRTLIHPLLGLQPYQIRLLAFSLGFQGDQFSQFSQIISNLYKLYTQEDASLLEINPLILDKNNQLLALDAKISFDDNALFRHPEIYSLRDLNEEDPKEVEASKYNLNYIALEGNIACLVNGAGLAMATMDIIKFYGGQPANFLDVGGGAGEDQVTQAFKIILQDPNVKGILVNIFGGIMKCDIIARGIINAVKSVQLTVPLVVRLEGTNVELGKQILKDSSLPLTTADSLSDAAQKIVKLASTKTSNS